MAARSDHAITAALSKILAQSRVELTFAPRAVSVMLHGLLDETQIQRDLFNGGAASYQADVRPERAEKRARLSETMDHLRAKHGPAAISYGPRIEVPGGYLGAKIAFGRIPDLQDFSEAQTDDGATRFYST